MHFFVIMIIISCVLISACVSPPRAKEPAMTTVKVAYLPLISNGPLFIAKEEGYFAQQGINAEFEEVCRRVLSSSPGSGQWRYFCLRGGIIAWSV